MKLPPTTRIEVLMQITGASRQPIEDAARIFNVRVIGGLLACRADRLPVEFFVEIRELDEMHQSAQARKAARQVG